MTTTATLSLEERCNILARAIQTQVVPGMRIESRSDFQAVLVFGEPSDTGFGVLLMFVTFGIFWVVTKLFAKHEVRRLLTVDEYGRIYSRDF